jgi:hypothetical protein
VTDDVVVGVSVHDADGDAELVTEWETDAGSLLVVSDADVDVEFVVRAEIVWMAIDEVIDFDVEGSFDKVVLCDVV